MNDDLPALATRVPGPKTGALREPLRRYESRNVTYVADDFPIFWESAKGALVTDVDGNRYVDLTAAFGVANTGHGNPAVVAAVAAQAARLLHGMGDVHPTAVRMQLIERLAGVLPGSLSKTFLATTGSEAVEAAVKTALLATGKPRLACYRGAYHGLSLGALGVCGIEKFREPFAAALGPAPVLLAYPDAAVTTLEAAIERTRAELGARRDVAALVIEPIQGRGGCIVPPAGYLARVRELCDELGILMIADEIYTGFGRTGRWFAIEEDGVVPDLICIGKAMGSGVPISAAVGRPEIMDAWPPSPGEALHTSTYLGNPLGCAAALATIDEIERLALVQRSARLGQALGPRLAAWRAFGVVTGVRGRGLLWGVQLRDAATAHTAVTRALAGGVILLQSGPDGDVISIAPPLTIARHQLDGALGAVEAVLRALA